MQRNERLRPNATVRPGLNEALLHHNSHCTAAFNSTTVCSTHVSSVGFFFLVFLSRDEDKHGFGWVGAFLFFSLDVVWEKGVLGDLGISSCSLNEQHLKVNSSLTRTLARSQRIFISVWFNALTVFLFSASVRSFSASLHWSSWAAV